ncbi:MAG TPA: PepSY domain-containing protein [Burkholderiales bacterium]|nr:PepSY domain-containing protein [Burkholderiales bacterium]
MRHNAPFKHPLLAGLMLTAVLAGSPAAADDDMAQMQALARTANLIPPEKAIEKALAAKPGIVIDADIDRKLSGLYYEIEVVDAQGVEWEIDIDAKTGETRRVKRDWFD